MTMPTGEKLQKVLARAGLGSRREMEGWIEAGRIQVNGRPARLGDRVGSSDAIDVDGRRLDRAALESQPQRVLLYHKPAGELCTRSDPEGRASVFDRLPRLRGARWVSVGRLDYNTSGLLLFTTDGELAHALMHPSRVIDREYICRVLGEVDDDMLQRLRAGVELEDGPARFTDLTHTGGEGANQWYTVCVQEGRNREVRRLWESQGVQVSRLKRVRYGNVLLPSRLRQGRYEDLPPEQAAELYRLAGLAVPVLASPPRPRSPARRTHLGPAGGAPRRGSRNERRGHPARRPRRDDRGRGNR